MQADEKTLYLSTPQAAAALGVSVSTVKRWVDAGILPAHRTAGGHRKLLRAEVLALVRQGHLPRGDLTALSSVSATTPTVDLEAARDELLKALLDGRGAEVNAVIRRVYDSGVAIETLADRVIAPAMARIGHDWEIGTIEVWQEHRGTDLCAAALYGLKHDLEARAEKNRPVAVGAAPEGDPYLLPTLLAQYVLLDAGWEAVNLGPNTPLKSLAEAIRELRPRLIWLSVSFVAEESSFRETYNAFYRTAEHHGVAVALGGRALKDALRSTIPYTTYGDGLEHLAAFARTLHPRPKPPRRGRPPTP
ncbi:MAG: helix-turn-helix domain-containing protein [Gemmataceae bacterium]|nr:helix-turn-helix domain-containing protein [Gemmataceae bacterium]MDW8266634.1 helix-turn-helix domain-containing protein [Gemmataceae bacterium]